MTSREAVRPRIKPATKQWSIPSKLTLAVLPIAVVALLAGLFLVWDLVSSDASAGFTTVDILAMVAALILVIVAFGSLVGTYVIGRSIAARIDEVSSAARRIANKDLVELLDALRAPNPDLDTIAPLILDTEIEDEVGELARSFEDLHGSLIEVAARQMEALRVGVSAIFVTLARRTSSLVDRQLALLDELESREEDSEVLGGYYQVDHLATRMRRNAESLLVLAGSEPPRVWAKATDVSDVVRAAVGEVDEYQRIEVLALEPARLSAGAVTDVAHLVAELLENAVQFSAPSERVRVTGLFNLAGYQLSVSDSGVGMSEARIGELNRILDKPPALGLSVEPTLGMYVVAKLAHRHGIKVELIQGLPGITARVTVPRDRLVTTRPLDPQPWEIDHGEGPGKSGQIEGTTHEYVLERALGESTREGVDQPILQPVATEPFDDVIDLTKPSMIEPDQRLGGSTEQRPTATDEVATELPVRTPGEAFRDESQSEGIVVGESASRIKSALSAYEVGRRAAVSDEQGQPDDPTEDRE